MIAAAVVGIIITVALLAVWVVAEVRGAIWMRTPSDDPWKKHVRR